MHDPAFPSVDDFLLCQTPEGWLQEALQQRETLVIDHANCEKKAAGSALSLMYRYVDKPILLQKLSRLAREELRHFEQVLDIMQSQQIAYRHLSASRYAAELRKRIRPHEPARLVDTLIVGAVVEARSCERFKCLSALMQGPLGKLYSRLLASEARHFADYLSLARASSTETISDRVQLFLELDQKLILGSDTEFRFHSGVPE